MLWLGERGRVWIQGILREWNSRDLLIHPIMFNEHLLSAGTVPGARTTAENKIDTVPAFIQSRRKR